MPFVFAILVFIFGLIAGSFLNVWIIRLGNGIQRYTRSKCLSCGYELTLFDLIPVASFLLLRGRCRECKSKISRQYIVVELLTAILFLLIFFRNGFSVFDMDTGYLVITLIMIAVVVPMIVMAVYDIRHKIVPLSTLIPFVACGIVFAIASNIFYGNIIWADLIAGVFLFIPFLLLWHFSHGKWIGFGDIILMFGIGVALGFFGGISAILIAFWSATIFLVLVMLPLLYVFDIRLFNIRKGFIMKSEIPLVPFLVFGTFMVLVFDWNIISLFI